MDPECAISSQVEFKDTSGIAYTECQKARETPSEDHVHVHVAQILWKLDENQTLPFLDAIRQLTYRVQVTNSILSRRCGHLGIISPLESDYLLLQLKLTYVGTHQGWHQWFLPHPLSLLAPLLIPLGVCSTLMLILTQVWYPNTMYPHDHAEFVVLSFLECSSVECGNLCIFEKLLSLPWWLSLLFLWGIVVSLPSILNSIVILLTIECCISRIPAPWLATCFRHCKRNDLPGHLKHLW